MKAPMCIAPFVSPSVSPDGFKLCSSPSMKSFKNLDDWNSEYAQAVRRGLLNDDPVDVCKTCLSVRSGLGSFNESPDEYREVVPVNFSTLRIARSNKCDYACEMCSAEISSSYDRELNDGKVGIIENDYDLSAHYGEVKSLAVSGGNPVLDRKLLPIMRDIMSNGVLESIIFTSNGSVFPDAFIELFAGSKVKTSLLFSVDAHKEVNEVVRKGVKQERFYRTVNHVIDKVGHNPNVAVFLEITLTKRTLPHLISLYREIHTNLPVNKIKVWVNLCVFPESLSLASLSAKDRLFLNGRLIPFFEFEGNAISESILEHLKTLRYRLATQKNKEL